MTINPETIRQLLKEYEKKIRETWDRITNEVYTPPISYEKEDRLQELIKTYKEIPKEVLSQNEQQRQAYVTKTRNEIIQQEIGTLKEKIQNITGKETSIEELLDITKIVMWNKLERDDYIMGKLRL